VLNPATEARRELSAVENELQSMIPETGSDFLVAKTEPSWEWRFLHAAVA
jgi:hypothetical protein